MSTCIWILLILMNLEKCKTMLLRGKRAGEGQFPWLIQFQTIAPCGGVLLSPDWVLTAAQCVQDKRNSIVLFASGLNGTGSKQTVFVKATYIYPQYEAYSPRRDRDHNIALLKLSQPFDMCNAKVTLPDVAPMKLDDNYKSCLIFGWQSYVSPSAKILAKPVLYSEVILNSWKLCTYMVNGNASYDNVFCTMVEFKDEMKACAGNPGSPVVCQNQFHKVVLLGVASWTNFSLDCGDLPTYLDVSVFRFWMHDLVFNNDGKAEKRVTDRSNNELCKYEDTVNLESNAWNRSKENQRTIQSLAGNILGSPNMPGLEAIRKYLEIGHSENAPLLLNKLYSLILDRNNYTKLSASHGYRNGADATEEQIRNDQQYEKIGESKYSESADHESMASSDEHEKLNYPDKTLSIQKNKKLNPLISEQEEDLASNGDDLEFIIPFTFKDTIASRSNLTNCSKNLIFFYLILLRFCY